MPRCLDGPYFTDLSWYRLSNSDLIHLPEVKQFLSTLEFCDAVIQVAHRLVREHLLGLIYMGFLVPVLKPALTQVRKYFYDHSALKSGKKCNFGRRYCRKLKKVQAKKLVK